MTTAIEPGMYWVRRKDDGSLTVFEVVRSSSGTLWVQLIGNLNCPDLEEAFEFFEIVARIPEPKP